MPYTAKCSRTSRRGAGRFLIISSFCLFLVLLRAGNTPAQIADPPNLALTQQFGGFVQPVHITHAGDGSGRMFISEQPGRIRIVANGVVLPVPFLDISAASPDPLARRVLFDGEQGLLSAAFPPGYAEKNHFYVYYTNLNGNNVIARYFLGANLDVANPLSEEIILVFEHPTFANHNGGQIGFGPDGFLYIAPGDGGGGCDPFNNAQNPLSLLGKMLRIDVESPVVPPATYNVPSTNPFFGTAGFRPEIWALGLRNPFRFSFDRLTGDLFIGDVGQNIAEEINFQPAVSNGGENYGWNIMEGSQCSAATSCPGVPCNQAGLTVPVAEYDHSFGCSVTGGFVYRGTDYPRMQGVYLYGDFCSGRIWGLKQAGTVFQNESLLDSPHSISTFGEDETGNLFLADYATGNVFIITDQIFADVPFGFWAHQSINAVFNNGITAGCGGGNFCPTMNVTREQMAAFLVRAIDGTDAMVCTGAIFNDVTPGNPFCANIERLFALGITGGCGGGKFCPTLVVSREQMAAFLVRAVDGTDAMVCTGAVFNDVTPGNPFCANIERLFALGITAGCGQGSFCPTLNVMRDQMAVFIGRAFLGLP
jgi:glucose/arabinose dehydrogenase